MKTMNRGLQTLLKIFPTMSPTEGGIHPLLYEVLFALTGTEQTKL